MISYLTQPCLLVISDFEPLCGGRDKCTVSWKYMNGGAFEVGVVLPETSRTVRVPEMGQSVTTQGD